MPDEVDQIRREAVIVSQYSQKYENNTRRFGHRH